MSPFFANQAQSVVFRNVIGQNKTNLLRHDADALSRNTGPITINSCPTDNSSAWRNPYASAPVTANVTNTKVLNLNANYTDGDYRIISQGFEVINTTAALTSQGLCTVWRSPVPALESASAAQMIWMTGGVYGTGLVKGQGVCSALVIDDIPDDINEALKLPNSKQWKAKEGCYVVGRINDCDNPVNNNSWKVPYFDRGQVGLPGSSDVYFYGCDPVQYTVGATPSFNSSAAQQLQWSNMDISGAIFSGLSLETSLTINWNIYIERFPSVQEPDLVVLAKAAPSYCPMAFELYKAIAMDLPVGCMQKENGLGDWFRDAVSTVSEIVTPVLSMIPHPAAQAGAALSRGIGAAVARKESQSAFVSENQERQYMAPVQQERLFREKPRAKIVEKEIKKEVKREVKPFLKRSKMSVMPSARKKANKK